MNLAAATLALIAASVTGTWMACSLASATQRESLRRARRRIAELARELENERRRNSRRQVVQRIEWPGANRG